MQTTKGGVNGLEERGEGLLVHVGIERDLKKGIT